MLDFDIKMWSIYFGVLMCLKCVSGDTQNVINLSQNLFLSDIIFRILKKCRFFLNEFWYDGKVPRFSHQKTCFLYVPGDCKKQLFGVPNFYFWDIWKKVPIFCLYMSKLIDMFTHVIFHFWTYKHYFLHVRNHMFLLFCELFVFVNNKIPNII